MGAPQSLGLQTTEVRDDETVSVARRVKIIP